MVKKKKKAEKKSYTYEEYLAKLRPKSLSEDDPKPKYPVSHRNNQTLSKSHPHALGVPSSGLLDRK